MNDDRPLSRMRLFDAIARSAGEPQERKDQLIAHFERIDDRSMEIILTGLGIPAKANRKSRIKSLIEWMRKCSISPSVA